jgi:hypothetical protein
MTAVVLRDLSNIARKASIEPPAALFRERCRIAGDVHSNHALAINKFAETRRMTSAGKITGVSIVQMNVAIIEADAAFWAGMSDMHRCKAHYRRGIAFESGGRL